MKKKLIAVLKALASQQARPAELFLGRLILAALGVKLGVDFKGWLGK